ncbi:unnamed protein product [Prorocentrum cordatum]|uniref:Uncharacterized protein n=1 Tax=Prorocentrum cordatum TaxID=2364126 RepID=A0ABN9RSG6_9DINO|nr:unnamed protein product [Polarella glacialis]
MAAAACGAGPAAQQGTVTEKVSLQDRVDALSLELAEIRAGLALALPSTAAAAQRGGPEEAPAGARSGLLQRQAESIFSRLEELRATSEGLSGRVEHLTGIVKDQARRIADLERPCPASAVDEGPRHAVRPRPLQPILAPAAPPASREAVQADLLAGTVPPAPPPVRETVQAAPPPPLKALNRPGGLDRATPRESAAAPRAAGDVDPITWSFHSPGPGEPGTRPYEVQGPGAPAFAAVDPGDEMLFVGGGAYNGAIARLLSRECQEPQDVDRYLKLHQLLLDQARAEARGTLVKASASMLCSHGALEWSGCRLFEGAFKSFGVVFVHIFKPACRPLARHNVALVYTVGPIGKSGSALANTEGIGDVFQDPKKFGDFLQATAESVIASVCEYNAKVAEQHSLPQIRVLRLPLVSGHTFRHPSLSQVDCARSMMRGVRDAAAGLPPGTAHLEVNFAYDGGCFLQADAQLRRLGPPSA